uniref:Uncharacterized protein n=1 Tax=Oryza brachyantha TaxID=4533 RepID=J3KW83_ORYBR
MRHVLVANDKTKRSLSSVHYPNKTCEKQASCSRQGSWRVLQKKKGGLFINGGHTYQNYSGLLMIPICNKLQFRQWKIQL